MSTDATEALEPPSPWYLVVAGAVVVLVLLAAGGFALRATSPAPAAAAVPPQDLNRQELEQTVATEPENLAARLELAHDYFDASDYDLALEQYLVVLKARPTHARALARSGWIAFEGGDNTTAQRLVTESLAVNADDPEALWFLAHIRLYGLRDPQGAAVPLERLLDRTDLSDSFRAQVEVLLERARDERI